MIAHLLSASFARAALRPREARGHGVPEVMVAVAVAEAAGASASLAAVSAGLVSRLFFGPVPFFAGIPDDLVVAHGYTYVLVAVLCLALGAGRLRSQDFCGTSSKRSGQPLERAPMARVVEMTSNFTLTLPVVVVTAIAAASPSGSATAVPTPPSCCG